MRSTLIPLSLAVCLLSTALAAPHVPHEEAPGQVHRAPMELLGLAAGADVIQRQLVGEAARFHADLDRVWVHATVRNLGAPGHITLVWRREGVERWRVDLNVGTSPRWRTWARRHLSARQVGRWTVTAENAEGEVMGSTGFIIEAPGEGLAALCEVPGC